MKLLHSMLSFPLINPLTLKNLSHPLIIKWLIRLFFSFQNSFQNPYLSDSTYQPSYVYPNIAHPGPIQPTSYPHALLPRYISPRPLTGPLSLAEQEQPYQSIDQKDVGDENVYIEFNAYETSDNDIYEIIKPDPHC